MKRMTVDELQSRLVAYMENLGANVKGVKGILTYYGFVFIAKTKLKELIAALDNGGMLEQLGVITADGVDVDLLSEAADYLIPKIPEKIEVGEFIFGHSDIKGFFDTLKKEGENGSD